jgi:hypothetical protein
MLIFPKAALTTAQPLIQWVLGQNGWKYKADHLPLSNAKVKNEWNYISIPPYAFTACRRAFQL